MASVQEPEVQFAQRLASNEKPVRTKAIKKLRKYINVRSQKATGGFTGDELLKLWKGLFYCLWMQDKPLLQEELSKQISGLIHSFQDVDGQFLYLESFLQTFKREWTGIDRLRMDKFYQLVRFMFRQTFEMLKRKNWESSVVARFLELLTAQLLQSSSAAPSGLQFHILDLYMTELAAVGTEELTADQNLIFIEPFCKTAAKTKDRTLLGAICNSIFSTIIDQAPFAIEDLMKEVQAAEASDSDSGQASEEDDEDQLKEETTRKPASKKKTGKQINGNKSKEEEEEEQEDDGEDDDDDELLHLEESDTETPCDDDVGPVLQFDYAALADKLFELASRSSTPSLNRQRLYKIIKVLRDLSEGVFPQDEYPEEVSTDEDDDMFGSRKRMKRGRGRVEEDEEAVPAAKKSKGKRKEASTLNKQNKDSAIDDSEPADLTTNNDKKKKKKRKKKKAGQGGGEGGEHTERPEQEEVVAQSTIKETEDSQMQSSVSSVKVTEAAAPEGQSETLLLPKEPEPSVTVTEGTSRLTPCSSDNKDQSENLSKTKTETSELKPAGEQLTPFGTEPETSSDADATASGKKKKKRKKGLKTKLETDGTVAAEITPISNEESAENSTTPETDTTTPGKKKKKKKKGLNAEPNQEEVEGGSQVNGVSTEDDGPTESTTSAKKKRKKKKPKAEGAAKVEADSEVEVKHTDAETTTAAEEDASTVQKKTKKKKEGSTLEASPAADKSTATPLKKKRKNNQKEGGTTVDEEAAAAELPQRDAGNPLSKTTTTSAKKKKKMKMAAVQVEEVKGQAQVVSSEAAALPQDQTEAVSSSRKPAKKRKIPVVFEFEADELEAAASINGVSEEETAVKKTKLGSGPAEPSTPLSTKKSQKKAKTSSASESAFITFQSNAAAPTPLFCRTKGGLSTPASSKKKTQTPKSESKKVTFGLKNNKTAEFRKTDRSLLVSPDGSSRVPFDPKQKPKCGVLKSPATPLSAKVRKTPNSSRKTSSNSPKSTPKRRPTAADFF